MSEVGGVFLGGVFLGGVGPGSAAAEPRRGAPDQPVFRITVTK
ncbi:hypothetical protein ACJ6WF_04775 [Streptomyces sp. MMS24-I2-30]